MRKIIFFIFLSALMVVGCKPKEVKERTIIDLGTPYQFLPEFLKGRVKEVKETLTWVKVENGVVSKGKELTVKERDSLGYSYDFNALFDENGSLVKVNDLGDGGSIVSYWSVENENGKPKKATFMVKDTVNTYLLFFYDDKECKSNIKMFRLKAEKPFYTWKLTNDSNCNYIKTEFFNDKDERTGHNEFTRNAEGKVLERKYYNMKDSLTFSMVVTYNNNGFYDSQESTAKTKVKYTLDYKNYDEKGNWLTATITRNGELKFFCERSYVYY